MNEIAGKQDVSRADERFATLYDLAVKVDATLTKINSFIRDEFTARQLKTLERINAEMEELDEKRE